MCVCVCVCVCVCESALSCFRRAIEGRRCCYWGGLGGPGRTTARLGWRAPEVAVGGESTGESISQGLDSSTKASFQLPTTTSFKSLSKNIRHKFVCVLSSMVCFQCFLSCFFLFHFHLPDFSFICHFRFFLIIVMHFVRTLCTSTVSALSHRHTLTSKEGSGMSDPDPLSRLLEGLKDRSPCGWLLGPGCCCC